ncbi:hypothetical protein [Pseudidiomarina sp. YC-516-91]|uniref:hypothetical protein n=1 Tax=Pseudidiomarina salilacus TaxID=3384452 RepID=UPI003985238D
MQPRYFIIQHSPQVPPAHLDFVGGKETVDGHLVVRALTWVMRVKDALPLEHVQLWFADGSDIYLVERSASGSRLWLCVPDDSQPITDWSREAIVNHDSAALDEYCEWRLNHGRVQNKHGKLEQLRENRDAAAQLIKDLNLDVDNDSIGFFRRYRSLEQLRRHAFKAQSATDSAATGLWHSQTLRADICEALQQRQEIAQLQNMLTELKQQALAAFNTREQQPLVVEIHRECQATEAKVARLESAVEATIRRYNLADLGLENTLEKLEDSVARQEQELAHFEQLQQQAEHNFEAFRRWLRLNSAVQRAEELHEEQAHG